MTDPIKKLREDMLAAYARADGNASAERDAIKRVFSAFEEEYEAREVRHDPSGPECYWTDMGCDGDPTTILVPRKTVSLREAAEALADAVSAFPMFSGNGALKAAEDDLRVKRDAVRAALAKEKR